MCEMSELMYRVLERAKAKDMVNRNGHVDRGMLAAALGVSYGYASRLITGSSAASMGREPMVKAAQFLEVSVLQAYVWAGVVLREDFFRKDKWEWEVIAGDAWQTMANHPEMGCVMVSREIWEKTPDEARNLMVRMFGELSGQHLIPPVELPPAD